MPFFIFLIPTSGPFFSARHLSTSHLEHNLLNQLPAQLFQPLGALQLLYVHRSLIFSQYFAFIDLHASLWKIITLQITDWQKPELQPVDCTLSGHAIRALPPAVPVRGMSSHTHAELNLRWLPLTQP